ncbi:MAG: polysaccharide deacetylase family protein [Intestinibacter bartlettii]|uniref:polysaccharide deacetylase family protein n=1 Tax=Intestinibacter bartlettii TaxID=261299 RepID=UPI0026F37CDA|nr:polysaccharide deacetylase family protein [Intestinibacter bartlettii]MDO5009684.1 polysaccharide deacetylase family protein [Intestinibacter bartlettii]
MNYKKYLKKAIALALLFFLVNTPLIMAYKKIDDKDNIIKNNSNNNMEIAITFDDGPHPKETGKILDILKKYNAKATFFVVGKHVKWYPDSVIRASKEGHEIANHTFTHPDISTLSEDQLKTEIKNCEDIIIEKTGKKPTLFRPPFGNYNEKCLKELSEDLGYSVVLWSGVDAKDWRNPPPSQIADKIINNVKQGDIILLHDYGTENTIIALDTILSTLTQKGYKFVTVSELLDKNNR